MCIRDSATVAQVVDVVHHATTVADLGQDLDHFQDVGRLALCGDQALGFFVVAIAEVLVVEQHGLAGDFLACLLYTSGQLFDVDRGVTILFHHALGKQDGVCLLYTSRCV